MHTPSSPAARLLIIEADPEIRTLLLALLSQEHYSCVAAASLEEARTLLEEQRFDLILAELLDTRPRDLFRTATCVQLLAESTPIALMTGWPITEEEARRQGFIGLLSKPFDLDYLLEWLAALVRQCALPEAAMCLKKRAEIES